MRKVSLDKSTARIGSMFDRIAPAYDFLNHFLSAGIDMWWRKMATASLPRKSGAFVLDVATGTGDLAFSLLKNQPDARVIGVDLALSMLKRARLKHEARNRNISVYFPLQGDALRLPIKGNMVDVVMIAYGIRNVPDVYEALREFWRVLKPGGHVLILEFSLPAKGPLRQIYSLYFNYVLPFLGGLISKDRSAYHYLTESVREFIGPYEMERTLEQVGFTVSKSRLLFGGISYFTTARKQHS